MYTLGELANELNRQEWAVERMLKNRGYLKNNGDPRKSTIDDGLMNKNGLIKEAGWSVFIDELGYKDTDEDEEDEIEDVDIDDDDDEDIEDDEDDDEDEEIIEDDDEYIEDEEELEKLINFMDQYQAWKCICNAGFNSDYFKLGQHYPSGAIIHWYGDNDKHIEVDYSNSSITFTCNNKELSFEVYDDNEVWYQDYVCPDCGHVENVRIVGDFGAGIEFCPKCGAQMDMSDDNGDYVNQRNDPESLSGCMFDRNGRCCCEDSRYCGSSCIGTCDEFYRS